MMRERWWWAPHGARVLVVRGPDPGLHWRELEREPEDEEEAYAIARGMALAEVENRARPA